jgi:hypothetical protein
LQHSLHASPIHRLWKRLIFQSKFLLPSTFRLFVYQHSRVPNFWAPSPLAIDIHFSGFHLCELHHHLQWYTLLSSTLYSTNISSAGTWVSSVFIQSYSKWNHTAWKHENVGTKDPEFWNVQILLLCHCNILPFTVRTISFMIVKAPLVNMTYWGDLKTPGRKFGNLGAWDCKTQMKNTHRNINVT